MSLSVFFSHSGKDREFGQQFAAQVQSLGITTYLFQNDAQPGRPLPAKIQEAIRQSDVVVALLTRQGDQSRYVHQEIGFALGLGKLVIPLLEAGTADDALGMLKGSEYLPFDINDPEKATGSLSHYLDRMQRQASGSSNREQTQRLLTILGAVLLLLLGAYMLYRLNAAG